MEKAFGIYLVGLLISAHDTLDEAMTEFRRLEAKSASYGNRVLHTPNGSINVWDL